MSYHIARINAIRNIYAGIVKSFVDRYKRKRKTVVLLPGGMGSQLDRSPNPYDGSMVSHTEYETVWMDVGIFFDGDALKLQIDEKGYDLDGHIIVPNGPLRFAIEAYDGTEQYFTQELGCNYVVFGYDWRRPLDECARYLQHFLALVRDKVFRRHREDPLPNTTLLCHSQGGLVAKLFINEIFDAASWFDKVITVGTPFYGTWSHQERYFIGQEPLSTLHGARRMAIVASTMPGPYTLMFIDKRTFDRDHEKLGFEPDDYPMTDPATGLPLDPYDLKNRDRYPGWINLDHLSQARQLRSKIANPLPDALKGCFYNIRSKLEGETPTRLLWSSLPPGFDPDEGVENPIKVAGTNGGGDGTVPFWSAWLADTLESNKVDLEHAKDHAFLMEHREVLEIVTHIIEKDMAPRITSEEDAYYGPAIQPVSRGQVMEFVKDVANKRSSRDDERAYDPSLWRGIVKEFKR